ncbi:MAG: ribose 5-phosphate isomerase B [Vicinamibacterales bacterium]
MLVALGADHAGFELKEALKRTLDERGVAYRDFGTDSATSVDYPDFAAEVARTVAEGRADRGILVCGSGVGMAIAANKVRGIRASVISDVEGAALAREHNDLNVLSLGARRMPIGLAADIVAAFLDTPFAGGRHLRRVQKIEPPVGPPGSPTTS